MFCPKCGKENIEGAQVCSACSWVLTSPPINPTPSAKTSDLAIAAVIMGALAPLTCITALPAIICGIIALLKINKSRGQLKGKGLAIASIALPVIALPIVMFGLAKIYEIAYRLGCEQNMNGLAMAMIVYANDHNDVYPTSSNWCDLLVSQADISPTYFVCKSSDAKKGECSYAINKNIINKRLSEIPPDIVVLFETDLGIDPNGRQGYIRDRESHEFFGSERQAYKVYKFRWNQTGGPEILTTKHHRGKGCYVLFGDRHVRFVHTKEIPNLKWTADANK